MSHEPDDDEQTWTHYLDTHYSPKFIDNPRNDIRLDCDRDLFMAGLRAGVATHNTPEVLREIRDAIAPDDGSAVDALNRVDAILDRAGILGPRRERLDPLPTVTNMPVHGAVRFPVSGEQFDPREQFEQDQSKYTHNTVSRMPSDDAIALMARQLGVKPEKVRSVYERASAGEVVEVHHYDIEKHAESFNEGYEAAMAQHLADHPTLAEDWLQEKVEAAFKAGAQWFIRIDFDSELSQEQRIERAWQTHLERVALLVPTSKETPKCLCDGGAFEVKAHPFIVHPDCPIHGAAVSTSTESD